jgi:hypothetical protein
MKLSKIITYLAIFFSIILFIYVFYRSEIYFEGNNRNHYIKYYIFCFILLLLSILSAFIPENIKIKLFLISTSIIISLYIIEFSLVSLNHFQSMEYKIKKLNENYDDRSKYDFYIDYKKKFQNAVIDLPPSLIYEDLLNNQKKYRLVPLSSISKRNTAWCNEDGTFNSYLSDRYGFNNSDKEWDKSKHIIFIGDSYTQGACVKEDENIPGNIKKLLKNDDIGIINLGKRGHGPLSEYATLVEYGKVTNPKIILWLYYEGNDLKNLKFETSVDILRNYLIKKNFSQNLINKQKDLDKILLNKFNERLNFEKHTKKQLKDNQFMFALKFFNLKKFIRLKLKKKSDDAKSYYKSQLENFEIITQKIKFLSKELDSKLIFIYIPSYERTNKDSLEDLKMYNYSNIIKIISKNKIDLIDLSYELFKKSNNPKEYYPYELPRHFSAYGYETIAKILYKKAYLSNIE